MRLTIACPEALRDDANQLAMVLGYGPSDAETYVAMNWQDAGGQSLRLRKSARVRHIHHNITERPTAPRMGHRQPRQHGRGQSRSSGAGVQPDACDGHA